MYLGTPVSLYWGRALRFLCHRGQWGCKGGAVRSFSPPGRAPVESRSTQASDTSFQNEVPLSQELKLEGRERSPCWRLVPGVLRRQAQVRQEGRIHQIQAGKKPELLRQHIPKCPAGCRHVRDAEGALATLVKFSIMEDS